MKFAFSLYEFAFRYSCTYCSTNTSFQNLHILRMNFLLDMNIVVSIAQQTF